LARRPHLGQWHRTGASRAGLLGPDLRDVVGNHDGTGIHGSSFRARRRESDRSIAAGFARPVPAMSGAEPCTGSKMPGPPSPRLAEAASPRPPVTAAA